MQNNFWPQDSGPLCRRTTRARAVFSTNRAVTPIPTVAPTPIANAPSQATPTPYMGLSLSLTAGFCRDGQAGIRGQVRTAGIRWSLQTLCVLESIPKMSGALMNDYDDKPYLLPFLFVGLVALSGCLFWISKLTGGPENGGSYDAPGINSAAWFGFLISAFFALMVGGLCLDRLAKWIESRRREPDVGNQ